MCRRLRVVVVVLGLGAAFLAGQALGPETIAPGTSAPAAEGFGLVALRNTYDPGEGAARHEHHAPRLVVVLAGGTLEVTLDDGTVRRADLAAGEVMLRGPEAHALRNVGGTTIELIEMEIPR